MGNKQPLAHPGLICSAAAHVVALVPFIFTWLILRELLGGSVDSGTTTQWAWSAVGAGLLHILLYGLALMLTYVTAPRVKRALRGDVIRRMLETSLGLFNQQNLDKLRNAINDNVDLAHTFCAHQLPDLAGTLVCLVALCVTMFILGWRMALLCLVPALIQLLAMGLMTANKAYRGSMSTYINHQQRTSSEAVEYVRGIPVMKAFQQSTYSFSASHQTLLDYAKWAKIYVCSCRRMFSIYTVVSFDHAFILIPFAHCLLSRGEDTVGMVSSLVFFTLVTPFIGECTMRLTYVVGGKREAIQAPDRLNALRDASTGAKGSTPLSLSSHTIQLEGASFRYNPETPLAVSDVTLAIPKGACVALTGASENDKTALARPMTHFWDAETGWITIGGEDISQTAVEEALQHTSSAFQSERLFKESIRDNVAYGSAEATGEEIYAVLDKAHCPGLMRSLPHGLDTVIGLKGAYPSGREQQRVALAGASLKDTPVPPLNEITSFADPESEHAVQESLHRLTAYKIVLIIAHRLSSVINADLIVVMQRGRIVEQGTHTELLARTSGPYTFTWQECQESVKWAM